MQRVSFNATAIMSLTSHITITVCSLFDVIDIEGENVNPLLDIIGNDYPLLDVKSNVNPLLSFIDSNVNHLFA